MEKNIKIKIIVKGVRNTNIGICRIKQEIDMIWKFKHNDLVSGYYKICENSMNLGEGKSRKTTGYTLYYKGEKISEGDLSHCKDYAEEHGKK